MFTKEEIEARLRICIREKAKWVKYAAKLRTRIYRYRKALKAIEELENMK